MSTVYFLGIPKQLAIINNSKSLSIFEKFKSDIVTYVGINETDLKDYGLLESDLYYIQLALTHEDQVIDIARRVESLMTELYSDTICDIIINNNTTIVTLKAAENMSAWEDQDDIFTIPFENPTYGIKGISYIVPCNSTELEHVLSLFEKIGFKRYNVTYSYQTRCVFTFGDQCSNSDDFDDVTPFYIKLSIDQLAKFAGTI